LRRHESDRIRFLPWVSGTDLDELLSNVALFVLPSELEGVSLALLDAMAAGVCALTSDIPEPHDQMLIRTSAAQSPTMKDRVPIP
jgi:glycosyltransferase involved in cell wall biosynthesis